MKMKCGGCGREVNDWEICECDVPFCGGDTCDYCRHDLGYDENGEWLGYSCPRCYNIPNTEEEENGNQR